MNEKEDFDRPDSIVEHDFKKVELGKLAEKIFVRISDLRTEESFEECVEFSYKAATAFLSYKDPKEIPKEAAHALVKESVQLLQKVEWMRLPEDPFRDSSAYLKPIYRFCMFCAAEEPSGHKETCALGKLLTKAREHGLI